MTDCRSHVPPMSTYTVLFASVKWGLCIYPIGLIYSKKNFQSNGLLLDSLIWQQASVSLQTFSAISVTLCIYESLMGGLCVLTDQLFGKPMLFSLCVFRDAFICDRCTTGTAKLLTMLVWQTFMEELNLALDSYLIMFSVFLFGFYFSVVMTSAGWLQRSTWITLILQDRHWIRHWG